MNAPPDDLFAVSDVARELDEAAQRVPPFDLESEGIVCCAAMTDADAMPRLTELLVPEHFYAEAHRRIFEAVVALHREGRPVDRVIVAGWLRDHDRLAQVGGMEEVTRIAQTAPVKIWRFIRDHAMRVHSLWRARQAIELGQRLTSLGYAGTSADALVDLVDAKLQTLRPADPAVGPTVHTVDSVLRQWEATGPLVHEPTGLARIDELTGGGPVYGSRWYLLGAPDAGKTALLLQLADEWQRRGVVVGISAIDEEADDLTTRLAQRSKFSRRDCEERSGDTLRELGDAMANVRVRMYGHEWTIESAAEDLAKHAAALGPLAGAPRRMALLVDSVQSVACTAMLTAEREMSERAIVTANVRALRSVASRYGMIVVATSEMNRNAYRNIASAEDSNDMSAGAESRAIEFSARVMLSLRSTKDRGELVTVRMVKNKHGASYPAVEDFYLAIDRRFQVLTMADGPKEDEATARSSAKTFAKKAAHVTAAARVAEYLARHPGEGSRGIRSALRLALGGSTDDHADDAVALLVQAGAVIAPPVKRGMPKPHHLDGSKLPPEVFREVASALAAEVLATRPPTQEVPS
jgi:replicative DNA helicase